MEYLGAIFAAFSGALIASFTMLVAERTHAGRGWIAGRSACNACGTKLSVPELIPIVSWLTAGGRCRSCGYAIPVRYLVGEGALALAFVLAYQAIPFPFPLLAFLAALAVLCFIVTYDLLHMIVPKGASLAFCLLALLVASRASEGLEEFGRTCLIAGGIGLAFFLAYLLSRGRAMGLGDAPIALSLSLLVGHSAAFPGLVFSFWIGAVIGVLILVARGKGHRMKSEVPFVPFLAAGFLLAYFTSWNPFAVLAW